MIIPKGHKFRLSRQAAQLSFNTQQRPMILVVDDVPSNAAILEEALSSAYRIKAASNGVDALRIAQRERPDLILLDVMMPGMDGFEVCRHLKEDVHTQNIPVIFVTAKNADADEELGLNLGAVDYIGKPFVVAIAKARIRNHIRLKQQADLLESLSLLDALTGIPNRRRFDEALATELKLAIRNAKSLSLLMIDIDHFKQFNDYYGHSAGDECLKMVAAELSKSVLRPRDLVARYGGEEFVAILPGTDRLSALQIAERLRKNIQKLGLPHAYSGAGSVVTISVGAATQAKITKNFLPQMLRDAADKALYMAKGRRNRVCFH
ncbi:diguanylate cyclase [Candidatus Methylobacter oryzae]|uniref:diguanylate cyclase n=1 Tax=Candidatus Methylobacter oryzae TaxID=2497749 RepID=A0ABY3CH89_9GAMM|nr:diguanylate cyclase [Candidatus Methylobacter oryzae]TRX03522.1 diguanylate cyclase [Candidatus Methylobacter oryzae]